MIYRFPGRVAKLAHNASGEIAGLMVRLVFFEKRRDSQMLVLGCGVNEDVVLTLPDGRLVVVAVLSIGKKNCRVGLNAPLDVHILRSGAIKRSPVSPVISTERELIESMPTGV